MPESTSARYVLCIRAAARGGAVAEAQRRPSLRAMGTPVGGGSRCGRSAAGNETSLLPKDRARARARANTHTPTHTHTHNTHARTQIHTYIHTHTAFPSELHTAFPDKNDLHAMTVITDKYRCYLPVHPPPVVSIPTELQYQWYPKLCLKYTYVAIPMHKVLQSHGILLYLYV